MTQPTYNKPIIITLVIIILILLTSYLHSCYTLRSLNQYNISLKSNFIDKQRLQDSSFQAQTKSLEITNKSLLYQIETQDSLIKQAVELLKQKGATQSTIVQTIQTYHTKDSTTVIMSDTVIKDSVYYVYPTYTKSHEDKWLKYDITADKDSTEVSIELFNQIDYTLKEKRDKWWKQPSTHITVNSKSPYSTITDIENIVVKNNVPRFGVGLSIGYGFTTNLQPAGYIGVSLSYRLFDLDFNRWLKKTKRNNTRTRQGSN